MIVAGLAGLLAVLLALQAAAVRSAVATGDATAWSPHKTALALVLLIGSALLMRSFDKLRHVNPGYDTENVFTSQIAPEGAHLEDAPSYARFHTDFMERVAALPGVETVGTVENVPLNKGLADRRFGQSDGIRIEKISLARSSLTSGRRRDRGDRGGWRRAC